MHIRATSLGRKFGREWIFRDFNYAFEPGQKYALVGNNGSGKSTMLQLLAGCMLPSEGAIRYADGAGKEIPAEEVYREVALAAPYQWLAEEFTLAELIDFVAKFKPLRLGREALIGELRLEKSRHKPIKAFSSGMKQRLQLGLAFFSQHSLLLLDEPTSNLDQENSDWYAERVARPMPHATVIISSNQPAEYACCGQVLRLHDYKPSFG